MDGKDIDIITLISERKIAEAREQGAFDNLEGEGRPLPEDDLANLPDEIRLVARVLRSSGMLFENAQVNENLYQGLEKSLPEEGESLKKLEKLIMVLSKPIGSKKRKGEKTLSTSYNTSWQKEENSFLEEPLPSSLAETRANKVLWSSYLNKILWRLLKRKDTANDL
jgi:hypothetical protein